MDELATYHCNACGGGYDGYHRCPAADDRVEFTCIDCGEHKNREASDMEIVGVAPQRCWTCTLNKMAQ
jgi:hypothetical protein